MADFLSHQLVNWSSLHFLSILVLNQSVIRWLKRRPRTYLNKAQSPDVCIKQVSWDYISTACPRNVLKPIWLLSTQQKLIFALKNSSPETVLLSYWIRPTWVPSRVSVLFILKFQLGIIVQCSSDTYTDTRGNICCSLSQIVIITTELKSCSIKWRLTPESPGTLALF